jgi:hypothetical protein
MNLKQVPGGVPSMPRADRAVPTRVDGAAPSPAELAAPSSAPGLAVNVKVSEGVAGPLAAAAGGALPDRELLDALKKRIQSGDFVIDYAGLARSMVEDAVLAIGQHQGPRR